jgi:hypothetical protein
MTAADAAHLMHVVREAYNNGLIRRDDRDALEMTLVQQTQADGVFAEFEQEFQELTRRVYWSRPVHAT